MSSIYRTGRNPAKSLYNHWRLVTRNVEGGENRKTIPFGRGELDVRRMDVKGGWIDFDFNGTTVLSIKANGDFRIGWMTGAMRGEDRRWKLYHSSFLDFYHTGREYAWALKPCFRPDWDGTPKSKWQAPRDHEAQLPYVTESAIEARGQYDLYHPWLRLEPDESWGWRIEPAKRQRPLDQYMAERLSEVWDRMVDKRERLWAASLRQEEIRTGVRSTRKRYDRTIVTDETVALFAAAFDLNETFVRTPLREAREAQHDRNHPVVQPLHP